MQVVKIKKLKSGENFLTHHWFIHNFPLPLKQVKIKFGLKVLTKIESQFPVSWPQLFRMGNFKITNPIPLKGHEKEKKNLENIIITVIIRRNPKSA